MSDIFTIKLKDVTITFNDQFKDKQLLADAMLYPTFGRTFVELCESIVKNKNKIK